MARELRMITSVDFDFRKLKHKQKDVFKKTLAEFRDDAVKQLKENITKQTYFKNKPIKASTRAVRLLRNRSGTKPLQDTGKLLKSIKATKKGISIMAYGALQNDGFSLVPNASDKRFGFYAPSKKHKHKRLIKVSGGSLKIPPRPWIIYNPDKKSFNALWNRLFKGLSVKRKTMSITKASL